MTFQVNAAMFVLLFFPFVVQETLAQVSCPSLETLCSTNIDGRKISSFVRNHKKFFCEHGTDNYKWIAIQPPCTSPVISAPRQLLCEVKTDGSRWFVIQNNFKVDSEENQYKLTVGKFDGNTYNEFSAHNNMRFSTPDRVNDIDEKRFCSQIFQAGWWYLKCIRTNLNGIFDSPTQSMGVTWSAITTSWHSLSSVEMKIRKKN
ncbi:BgiBsFReDn30 [Biomphalaria glabrata]|nr:BgiBsFReDn30 [Biomphalaria glabrata]